MLIAFNSKNEITDHKNLFGREILFNQLVALANRKSNVELIGLRRYGKTSLFKCLENYFRSTTQSNIYPIYIDFKEVGSEVAGTANVYRYLTAIFLSRLSHDKVFIEPICFRNQELVPSDFWEDIYQSLSKVDSIRVAGLFEEVIGFFSDLIEKSFLCLIDEYEYLFKYSFDNPVGFQKLRNFASKTTKKGVNPFIFFVAGGVTWERLCSITGSGELNCIDHLLYVPPLEFEDFIAMWKSEAELLDKCPDELLSSGDFAYEASGGVPFYGKVIGSAWLTHLSKPNYRILKSHFQELLYSLETEHRNLLYEAIKNSSFFQNSHYFREVLEIGLLNRKDGKVSIRSAFFREFLTESQHSNIIEKNLVKETFVLADRISDIIMNINNTMKNKSSAYIFEPVNDEAALLKDLRTPCFSEQQFSDFASSLYKIIFERTKTHNRPLNTLPKQFKHNNEFLQIVGTLRHSLGKGHLMDKFTPLPNQLSKAKVLQILTGSRNEPRRAEDFYFLQTVVLKRTESELIKLNEIVRKP